MMRTSSKPLRSGRRDAAFTPMPLPPGGEGKLGEGMAGLGMGLGLGTGQLGPWNSQPVASLPSQLE